MRVLHLDQNHPVLAQGLDALGCKNDFDHNSSYDEILEKIGDYQGMIIRSRIPIDHKLLSAGKQLKFIGRVGAGLENIDIDFASKQGIQLFSAPEGNRTAVGEHSLALLLNLTNRINSADVEIRSGQWRREDNRGFEIAGKQIGIIGYGHMGKSFAKVLKGLDCSVVFYDLDDSKGDENAKYVPLETLKKNADIISIHTPQTDLTKGMINNNFINSCGKNFYLINTARGSAVVTDALVSGLKSGKVRGAGLDVLEYEKTSFENFFQSDNLPESFRYLIQSSQVILTPHVAGWTVESKYKLADTIVQKVKAAFY
jgi:D-3-phosphoglycerate dehydrogenase